MVYIIYNYGLISCSQFRLIHIIHSFFHKQSPLFIHTFSKTNKKAPHPGSRMWSNFSLQNIRSELYIGAENTAVFLSVGPGDLQPQAAIFQQLPLLLQSIALPGFRHIT